MYGNLAGFDPSIQQHNGIGVELSTFKIQKNPTEQKKKKFPTLMFISTFSSLLKRITVFYLRRKRKAPTALAVS
jgi:hypothetical protein